MKTLVAFNIGLNTIENNRLDIHRAIGAIAACGVSITTSAVVNGEWNGKPEPCLFIQGFVADPFAVGFRAQLYLASRLLSQHVIALYHDGRGELIGENPGGWTFDAEKFHFHPEGKRPVPYDDEDAKRHAKLSECQAIQKETAERLAKRTENVYADYIENQTVEQTFTKCLAIHGHDAGIRFASILAHTEGTLNDELAWGAELLTLCAKNR